MTTTIQYKLDKTDHSFTETNKSLQKWAVEDMGVLKESLTYSTNFAGRVYTGKTSTGKEITFGSANKFFLKYY